MSDRKQHHDQNAKWWLQAGTEHCQFCGSWFHYEAGGFCTHCDSQVCPICISHIRVARRYSCPDCLTEAED